MKPHVLAFLLAVLFTYCGSWSQAQPYDVLFDGHTLTGWKTAGGSAQFTVEDGCIVGHMTMNTGNTFLVTERHYKDFVLELDVKLEGAISNSGVQIRSYQTAGGQVRGKQVEIDPTPRAWTGGIYEEGGQWLYPLDLNESAKAAYRPGEFNRIKIEAIGPHVKTWVNGVPAAYVVDPTGQEGLIGLQVHGIGTSAELDGKKVYFKNIRIQIKRLRREPFPDAVHIANLEPNSLVKDEKAKGVRLLFDGRTLRGWKSVRTGTLPERGWHIENGVITVAQSGGAESAYGGDIVTSGKYAAFDLTLEFRLTPGANSGIKYFVSLLEKTEGSAIGLEYQLLDDAKHPDAKLGRDGNRTLASLYDLIPANKANYRATRPIGEWNTARILVTPDNKVTHWLNGIKVLEYTRGDSRYRDLVAQSKYAKWENFGMAAEGHILLQDHGDEVSFRSIKVRRLKK